MLARLWLQRGFGLGARLWLKHGDLPLEQRKVDWARLTEYDLWKCNSLTDRSLSDIDIPIDAIMFNDIDYKNNEHHSTLHSTLIL